ncbi:hypothetical protein MTO96_023441 [Rhipicephalus appendiculatus]
MVRKGLPPRPDFKPYDASLKALFSTYEEARRKLDRFRFSSDVSMSEDDKLRKRKRTRPAWLEFSSESEADDLPDAPLELTEPSNSSHSQAVSERESTASPMEPAEDSLDGETCSNSALKKQQPDVLCVSGWHHQGQPENRTKDLSCADFQKRILTTMSIIKHTQTEIIDMLSTLWLRNEKPAESCTPEVLAEPLESVEAVKAFDATLTDGKREALFTVKTMLNHLMTDAAAMKFSMDGRKGKERFRDLQLWKVLFEAVRRTKYLKDTTWSEVEYQIKEWLRRAKELYMGNN